MSALISDRVGPVEEWITNMDSIRELAAYADDDDFQEEFVEVKKKNKLRLKNWVKEHTGIDIPLDSLYDI